MVQLTFVTAHGPVQIEAGGEGSVMRAAKAKGVEGIDADCGGSMVCGTCHVIIVNSNGATLPEPTEMEAEILEYVPEPHPDARLSCQLNLVDCVDGMVFKVPALQH